MGSVTCRLMRPQVQNVLVNDMNNTVANEHVRCNNLRSIDKDVAVLNANSDVRSVHCLEHCIVGKLAAIADSSVDDYATLASGRSKEPSARTMILQNRGQLILCEILGC